MAKTFKPDARALARGSRLKAIRIGLHNVQRQIDFARLLGVSQPRYCNWETKGYPIPSEEASKIKAITPEVDLDYILEGDIKGLTAEALKKLRKEGGS